MEKTLEELKAEASDLGITYSPNISAVKLAAKIEEFYAAQETPGGVVAAIAVEEPTPTTSGVSMGVLARQMESEARVTHVVTITDNDQRENNMTTTVSVSCGNDYFDLGMKRVPLNIPVELEQGFINVLKEIVIPMHVQNKEGVCSTVRRNRYAIAYSDEMKQA